MVGCADRVLGQTDSDSATGGATDPTSNPSDPSSDPTSDPSNPTSDPTSDPTDPTNSSLDGPPQLLDVRVIDADALELFFSEAMGDPSAVDASLFRLSIARGYSYYGYGKYNYENTFYWDLSRFSGGTTCYEYCWCDDYVGNECQSEVCNEYCNSQEGPSIDPVSVEAHPSAGDRLILRLDSALVAGVCEAANNGGGGGPAPGQSVTGLFLHYSNNGSPVITDREGESLAPLAEHWVLPPRSTQRYGEGFFAAMDPYIRIECPF